MKNFRKILYITVITLFTCFVLYTNSANARVRFLGDSTDEENFDTPGFGTNAEWCKSQGYNQTGECTNKNEKPGRVCTRDSNYFDKCCNMAYNYKLCSYPNERSKNSCGGRYKCVCDRKLYPIEKCESPQIPSRDACTEDYFEGGNNTGKIYYSSCDCPHYYQACDGKNLMGDTAIEQECKGTYAACKCKDGFDKSCSDYGTKKENDTNYCYLNGTKWYTEGQCRSAADFCAKQGYTNVACPDDEMAVQYCPQDSSYFLCRKDPAKYCTNKQYNKVGEYQKWGQCGKYKTQNQSKKCSYKNSEGSIITFGDYYLCEESCKSQMYDNDYVPLSDGHEDVQWYKKTTTASKSEAIILGKNLNFKSDTAFRDPYGNQYAWIKGVTALYDENPSKYSKCRTGYAHPNYACYYKSKSWEEDWGNKIASINIREGSGLNRHFKNITIIMSLEQNGGEPIKRTFTITGQPNWFNVNLGYDHNDSAGSTKKTHWYNSRLFGLQNTSVIDISGVLFLHGTNKFCAGSDNWIQSWENGGQKAKHYVIKVQRDKYFSVENGSTHSDVAIYNDGAIQLWGSTLNVLEKTGITSSDTGSLIYLINSSYLNTDFLGVQGNRHLQIRNKSKVFVSGGGRSTYIGKDRNICITGGSEFRTVGTIDTCRRGEICLGSGGTSLKVQNSTLYVQNTSYRRKDSSGCDDNANPIANGWFLCDKGKRYCTWNERQCQNRCGSPSY